ncbi:bifunctional metallophosphatase/5'-nucleotidase [Fructilactobacillus cliffordii]|uniref:Bifunctional metallophosphatase/5'-nucleotidase n=1 Tax=Fructilactobacillus cliffordii TaxID=2940299 RepID=A0A9Q8ZRI2_9LACO|nr:bifunctional UDP-sugar hydrolase/5'-nucleotidase [Fructilactobacillus cliffordii]USS86095.1 bifunctional metallophosphatase/5'-nucleotidase [Fructilactobacillus cliffordii]USS89172.1 bifunctional metallophosphatase/5'-nucleotidase [Fructilactobacillus cliffordii]
MKLTILTTSDTHGFLAPTNYVKPHANQPFGLEKAATILKREQEKSEYHLTLDDGDFLEGSPLAYYQAEVEKAVAPTAINAAFNSIEYDFGTVGNHEFNYGQEYLKNAIAGSQRQFVSANILNADGTPAFGDPYAIKTFGDLKVAVLGLTTQSVDAWENQASIHNLKFISALEAAQKYVPEMREKADVVVVLYHGGFERDLSDGKPNDKIDGENEAYAIMQQVPGIDVMATGHQHRALAGKLFGIPYVQPGHRGSYVGRIQLDLERVNGRYQVQKSHQKLIKTGDAKPDATTADSFTATEANVEKWLALPLAHIDGSMTYDDPFQVRLHGSAFVNFIQKVQMETMGCDVSATALFSNEARGFENPITMRNIITNYVYPNTLSLLEITGADLKAALEKTAEYFTIKNDQIIVDPKYHHPKIRDYNYDMYAGIDYTIKVSNPIGKRVINPTYHGKPVTNKMKLKIVLNTYRAVGGGHYPMYSEDKVIRYDTITMSNLIAKYLQKHPEVKADHTRNFKVIK